MKFFTEKSQAPPKEKVLDIKTLLKFARQYIDENNMKKAQQCCKKVLRQNNQNYMALVLLGKSYGKTDDAPLTFEKAIELKPDHLLAWQGLANYYEVKEDESAKIKLLSIYDKILKLNTEEDFAIKTLTKYGQLGCVLQNNDTLSSLTNYITVQENEKLIDSAKTQVLQLLKSNVTCKNEDIPAVIKILKNLNNNDLSDDNSELILLGELIFQITKFRPAIEEIMALEIFPRSLIMKQWLCQILCKTFVNHQCFCGFDLDHHINELTTGIENTKYGGILVAIGYYRRSMFKEAYRKCISTLQEPYDLEETEALFMLNCSRLIPDPTCIELLCEHLLKKENLNNPAFIATMNINCLSYYMRQKKFHKSLEYLKIIPTDKIDANILTELANLFIQSDVTEDVTWQILDSTDYFDLFKAFALIKCKKFSEAVEILQLYTKHPVKYYYLAIGYWFTNRNDEAFETFLKAAEVTPYHPKVHYCLGLHYYRQKDDIEESKKHLEKSYALYKADINVVKMLSIIYLRLGLVDMEFELLQCAFDTPQTRAFWVCARLGRIYYNRGIMDDALMYLQTALQINPDDVIAQEWIGDIYFTKRDYDQALTIYNKVLELSQDNNVFFKCLNRIGCIYSEQMSYQKAIYIFDSILDNDAGNIAALRGITDNRVIAALKSIANDLFHDAREHMQCAINRITRAMSMGIKDLAYWHLYGDVLIVMTRLPNEYSFVNLKSSGGQIRKEKIDMYKMAIDGYSKVLKFRDSIALFKCALAYFKYYSETKNIAFCQTSYNLAVLTVKVNPNVWPTWDLLGNICVGLEKNETAYYCFSKALALFEDCESKIWSGLAIFYLKLGKPQLGRYKHLIERYLPTITQAWLREELSKTTLNNDENSEMCDVEQPEVQDIENNDSIERPAAFRPMSIESAEPSFDFPIRSLKVVPNANEVIEWYLCFEEETVWSCTSLGSLQERKGLYIPALRYYDRAYTVASNNIKNQILSLKGRVLIKMREFEEAINVYNQVRVKKFGDACGLGFALYKMGNHRKAYAIYEKAFNELCINDEQRIDILVIMANVGYRLNGLHYGAMLLLKALKIKYGENEEFNLIFMKEFAFQKVDMQLVAYIMSEYLLKHFDKATWWYFMGLNYLRGVNKYGKRTKACIKRAIRVNTEPSRNGKLCAMLSVAEFYSGNPQQSLEYATRALKLYPIQPELWAVFILCIYADKTWPRKTAFLRVVIKTVRKLITVSRSMERWLKNVEEDIMGVPKKFNYTQM